MAAKKNKTVLLLGSAALAAFYFFNKGTSTPQNPNVNPYDEKDYTGPVDAFGPKVPTVDANDLGVFSINGPRIFI